MRVLWKATVPAVVLAAACGSGASPDERVVAAPAETVASRTARLWQRIEVTPGDGGADGEPTVAVAKGVIDFANRQGSMTVAAGEEEFEVVFRGTTLYEHLPEIAGAAGKEWLRIDLDEVGGPAELEGLSDLLQAQSDDPATALWSLHGAGQVSRIGKEAIRGARTTWFEATVDVDKAAAAAPAEQQAALGRIKEAFGVTRIPTDVWIDGDGRVRRLKQTLDYTGAAQVGSGSLPEKVELTLELYDFGTPVSVRLPPPDDVADYAEVVERAENGEGSGTATPATEALVARLLAQLPPGYEQEPDSVGDTGPSDFEKAVRDDGGPDARQVLQADGFVAGYQRLWTKGEESTVIDFVYQFSGPPGAAHYLERTMATFTDEGTTSELAVPGVPGAKGIRIAEDDEHTAVVFLTRGPFLAQIVVIGRDAMTDVPVELARQQYDRLG